MSAQMCIYVTNSAELYKNTTENRKVHICQDFFFWFRGVIYKNVGFYLEGVWLCEELVGDNLTNSHHPLNSSQPIGNHIFLSEVGIQED